jgi:hypothetical protein
MPPLRVFLTQDNFPRVSAPSMLFAGLSLRAVVISEAEVEETEKRSISQEDILLDAIASMPNGSLADWAKRCNWYRPSRPGEEAAPNKSLAQRVLGRLVKAKLVVKNRRTWTITKVGERATVGVIDLFGARRKRVLS